MVITINSIDDMKAYYDEKSNTYSFVDENGRRANVKITCDISVPSYICAGNIKAGNIKAYNINAHNINASNIDASNILYWAVCIAYCSFKCFSCTGRRENALAMCLDGEIVYKEDATK